MERTAVRFGTDNPSILEYNAYLLLYNDQINLMQLFSSNIPTG